MNETIYCKVVGQLTMRSRVSLIAEESVSGLTKGQVITTVARCTFCHMKEPKRVELCPGGRRGHSHWIPVIIETDSKYINTIV